MLWTTIRQQLESVKNEFIKIFPGELKGFLARGLKAHVPDLHGTQEESSARIAKKSFRHALLRKKASGPAAIAGKTFKKLFFVI